MTARLSVNLNAIAMLRNRRNLPWPDVERTGHLALTAGAHGLTVHPRPDQRHIRYSDIPVLRTMINDRFPQAEFNIEGYPTRHFIDLVLQNKPEQVTLVPDTPSQATSDHGWNFKINENLLKQVTRELKNEGHRVSLFCDPDAAEESVKIAADIGADRIELYTQPYAICLNNMAAAQKQVELLKRTAQYAEKYGMGINAGHDLTVQNLPLIVKTIPRLAEVSIGHGITADALEFGMAGSVRRFLGALEKIA